MEREGKGAPFWGFFFGASQQGTYPGAGGENDRWGCRVGFRPECIQTAASEAEPPRGREHEAGASRWFTRRSRWLGRREALLGPCHATNVGPLRGLGVFRFHAMLPTLGLSEAGGDSVSFHATNVGPLRGLECFGFIPCYQRWASPRPGGVSVSFHATQRWASPRPGGVSVPCHATQPPTPNH